MKSKKAKYILTAVAAITLLGAGAYAATMNQLSYVERFETGKIDIDIQELSVIGEGETAESEQIVEANKDVSYIPRIVNRNADCYVRAHIDVVMNGDCEQPLKVDHIYGLSEDWVNKGEYFYYTKVLKQDQETDLFKGIHIPQDWDYGDAEGFSVSVKVDAVQSANFAPDFSREMPWGAVELKDVSKGDGSELQQAVSVSRISDVEYTSSGGFQCGTDELFDEFSSMMPGSSCQKIVNLKNSAKGSLKASLKVTAANTELNQKMLLCVSADGKEIYRGTVAGANDLKGEDMMEIEKGKTGNIKLEMALPADADNSYTELKDDIVWDVSVREIRDENAQTGDGSDLLPYIAAALLAMMLMIYLVRNKREGRNGTSH